jgi:ribosomal protein S18 acetylase RimI-like enzyme
MLTFPATTPAGDLCVRGLPNAIRHGLVTQRVIERLKRIGIHFNPYYLLREGVRPHQTDWPELASEFPTSVLDPADAALITACHPHRHIDDVRARLDKGHLCIVLNHGTHIAGFTWADFDEVNDSACDYLLGSDEAYLYDAYIAPEHRGRGLAPYMRTESYRHLRQAGRHTFYSISDYFNTPAIRFKQKLNAEFARLYLQINVGSRELGQWCLRDYDPPRKVVHPQDQ